MARLAAPSRVACPRSIGAGAPCRVSPDRQAASATAALNQRCMNQRSLAPNSRLPYAATHVHRRARQAFARASGQRSSRRERRHEKNGKPRNGHLAPTREPGDKKNGAKEIVTQSSKPQNSNRLRPMMAALGPVHARDTNGRDGDGRNGDGRNGNGRDANASGDARDAFAAQKSPRIEMIQSDRKIPWTKAAGLSFTVGWWKESFAVIGQVGTGLSGSRTHFRR